MILAGMSSKVIMTTTQTTRGMYRARPVGSASTCSDELVAAGVISSVSILNYYNCSRRAVSRELKSVDQPPGDFAVGVDAAVPQKRPMRAGLIYFSQVERDHQRFLFADAGFGENLTGSSSDETLSPKLDSIASQNFGSDAIRHSHITAIGDGVSPLNGFPGRVLTLAMLGFFPRVPSNGGWIKDNFSALHGGQPGSFGIPLVPTDQHADLAIAGGPGSKAEVAGCEIEFFIEQRIIRNVHLTIDTQ